MMHATIRMVVIVVFFLGTAAGQASALTFYLDQVISGKSLTPSPSYGTISLTQAANGDVKVDVELTDTTQKLLEFALNYSDGKFNGSDHFSLTGGTGLEVSENGTKMGGYGGRLDFVVPGNGNLGNVSSFSAILHDSRQNITPNDFNFTDTNGNLYGAAHIGSLTGGDDNLWVGSGNPPTAPVPEPGTVMLVGCGFLGLALYSRRRVKA